MVATALFDLFGTLVPAFRRSEYDRTVAEVRLTSVSGSATEVERSDESAGAVRSGSDVDRS